MSRKKIIHLILPSRNSIRLQAKIEEVRKKLFPRHGTV